MTETNEQRIARIEVKMAIEDMLRACGHNNMLFCGFAYGADPPIIIEFGNVTEKGDDFRKLLNSLCDLVEEPQREIVHDPLNSKHL